MRHKRHTPPSLIIYQPKQDNVSWYNGIIMLINQWRCLVTEYRHAHRHWNRFITAIHTITANPFHKNYYVKEGISPYYV